jgi:hypothetical protein
VGDEYIWGAHSQDRSDTDLGICLSVPDAEDGAVSSGRGGAYDGGACGDPESEALRRCELGFGVPPAVGGGVPVEASRRPSVDGVVEPAYEAVACMAVGVDEPGHDGFPSGVDGLVAGVFFIQLG